MSSLIGSTTTPARTASKVSHCRARPPQCLRGLAARGDWTHYETQMSRNESGGDYDAPNDRSTASEYTAPAPYKVGKGPGIPAALPDQVFAALQAVDKPGYVRPGDLGLDASDRSVSAAIGLLADDDGCPLDIERWNGANTTPAVWRVKERERRAVTDGGEYTVTTEEITVVDGVEIDITVRDTGAGERRVDHTLTELKTHLGRIATAFEQRTPPLELEEIPDQNKPMFSVAWDRVLGDDDPEPATDGDPDHDVPVAEQLTARQRELVGRDGGGDL
jgi:hypothetical protein